MARTKFIKVSVPNLSTDLTGCSVVGHRRDGDSFLLLERPEAKPRAKAPAARKPRARSLQDAAAAPKSTPATRAMADYGKSTDFDVATRDV